ncbi:hypothetical protein [Brevundimonas aveniformis]|nr:hypothetical protein [Brevundimonas aveniformis]
MSDDLEPEDAAADDRIEREGFNPLLAVGLIVLLGIAAYIAFAVIA